jgi:hypothetical protein
MSVGGVAFAVLLVLPVLSLSRGWSGFGRFSRTAIWMPHGGEAGSGPAG